MQITRTLNQLPLSQVKSAPALASQSAPEPHGITRDDVYAGASGVAGGAVLGLGGAYLGMTAGMDYGMRAAQIGGGPVGALLGVLVAIPVGIAYGMMGAAVGGAVGATIGTFGGVYAYDALSR